MNVLNETTIATRDARVSINGRPVSSSTMLRWMKKGVRGVRLEGCRVGGRWHTSREALARFLEKLNPIAVA